MAHALKLHILLTALGIVVVPGTTSFAQQTVTPSLQPQLLPQTSTYTTCTLGCDMQAMGCQSQCVPIGPVATPTAASSQCPLSCATQQLVCKQNCR